MFGIEKDSLKKIPRSQRPQVKNLLQLNCTLKKDTNNFDILSREAQEIESSWAKISKKFVIKLDINQIYDTNLKQEIYLSL